MSTNLAVGRHLGVEDVCGCQKVAQIGRDDEINHLLEQLRAAPRCCRRWLGDREGSTLPGNRHPTNFHERERRGSGLDSLVGPGIGADSCRGSKFRL